MDLRKNCPFFRMFVKVSWWSTRPNPAANLSRISGSRREPSGFSWGGKTRRPYSSQACRSFSMAPGSSTSLSTEQPWTRAPNVRFGRASKLLRKN